MTGRSALPTDLASSPDESVAAAAAAAASRLAAAAASLRALPWCLPLARGPNSGERILSIENLSCCCVGGGDGGAGAATLTTAALPPRGEAAAPAAVALSPLEGVARSGLVGCCCLSMSCAMGAADHARTHARTTNRVVGGHSGGCRGAADACQERPRRVHRRGLSKSHVEPPHSGRPRRVSPPFVRAPPRSSWEPTGSDCVASGNGDESAFGVHKRARPSRGTPPSFHHPTPVGVSAGGPLESDVGGTL